MTVSATGSSPAFSQFGSSSLSFSAAQQLQGAASSIDSSLLTATFGTPSDTALGSAPGVVGAPASSDPSDSSASMASLLAAYVSTKSLNPVALAYLQNMPTSTTTSTLL